MSGPGVHLDAAPRRWRRLATAYRATAAFLLNVVLAFVVLNAILWIPFGAGPWRAPEPPTPEFLERFRAERTAAGAFRAFEEFFPALGPDDVGALVLETLATYARPFRYEPFTQFREAPRRGRFVNVDPAGFRWGRPQGPWPPDPANLNVFVFGGSTTFGYGLPDEATVPAQLQAVLADPRVRVYNFGRGWYYSSQEHALFGKLLREGRVPHVAIFVDGLNDFYNARGEPEFTERLAAFMAKRPEAPPSAVRAALDALPIGRAATWAGTRLRGEGRPVPPRLRRPVPERQVVRRVIRRWRRNRAMTAEIGAAFGVRTVFVWQPVPTYGYDLAHHRRLQGKAFGAHERSRAGYPVVARLHRAGRLGPDVVWCAEIQRGLAEALYLDAVHYTPAMARRVAECIAAGLRAAAVL